MATIVLSLSAKTDKVTSQHEVLIRFFHGRINQRAKTNVFVKPDFWDEDTHRIKLDEVEAQLKESEGWRKMTPERKRRKQELEALKKELQEKTDRLNDILSLVSSEFEKTDKKTIAKDWLKSLIDGFNFPKQEDKKTLSLVERFMEFVRVQEEQKAICIGRRKHYDVLGKELKRFLIINDKEDIEPNSFDKNELLAFRTFLFDEYKNTGGDYEYLYRDMKKGSVPSKRRSNNTVATKLKILRAFFNDLEKEDKIDKSPFKRINDTLLETMMNERYDEPVCLKKDELLKIINTDVPQYLKETKDLFLLHCSLGCRVGDFQKLTMENVSVTKEGVMYVHYLPNKTLNKQTDNKEIETPVMRFARDIILNYRFNFPSLRYVYGKSGYNSKVKLLLKHCKIDRECKVFDSETGKNVPVPLYEIGSSKLARKTFVDIMAKVQINIYASGLHKDGSSAAKRYTSSMEILDRFNLMCVAFGQPEYRVDGQFNIIDDKGKNDFSDLMGDLTNEEKNQIMKMILEMRSRCSR